MDNPEYIVGFNIRRLGRMNDEFGHDTGDMLRARLREIVERSHIVRRTSAVGADAAVLVRAPRGDIDAWCATVESEFARFAAEIGATNTCISVVVPAVEAIVPGEAFARLQRHFDAARRDESVRRGGT